MVFSVARVAALPLLYSATASPTISASSRHLHKLVEEQGRVFQSCFR